MPRFDLNGDPMPDDAPPPAAQQQQYDLVGNPIPAQPPPAPVGTGQPVGAPTGYGQPARPASSPAGQRSTYFDGKQYRFADEKPPSAGQTATKIAIACVGALALAILGSIGVMKIAFFVGKGFTALYVLLGFGVGLAVSSGFRNKLASVGIAFVILALGLFIGHITFTQDAINKYPDLLGGVPLMTAFPRVMDDFKSTHWMFVAFTFVACLRAAVMKVGDH